MLYMYTVNVGRYMIKQNVMFFDKHRKNDRLLSEFFVSHYFAAVFCRLSLLLQLAS